jgi:hypothetical protein
MHGEENHLINPSPFLCPLFYLIQSFGKERKKKWRLTSKKAARDTHCYIDEHVKSTRRRRSEGGGCGRRSVCEFARAFPVSYLRYCL